MCAHAVSVAIQKIDGVASVDVSLNGGFADVRLKPGNRVDPERIRRVARDNGFTPKGAEVKVGGQVIEHGGKLALRVTGLDVVYLLIEHPEAKGKLAEAQKAVGRSVLVTGYLAESATAPPPDAPNALELRDLTLESNSTSGCMGQVWRLGRWPSGHEANAACRRTSRPLQIS